MIDVENISKKFDDLTAVSNLSFKVNENELFGLIGPDGAGKTTLIRMLISLMIPSSGSICVAGIDVVKDYKQLRQIVGYMPGKFSLYQDLTVEENLQFFASVFNTTIEENYHLIEDVYKQIEPFKKRRAGKLSGGMKQKLALSCALIHKPKVLFLDEPTTGVDAVSRSEFWDMLGRLKKAGITIFVSTPYMDEAARCDRVALMQKGEILTIDKPIQIVKGYGKQLYKIKADDTYRLLQDLKAWEHTISVFPFGQFLHLSVNNDLIVKDQIVDYLKEKKYSSLIIETSFSNIEDVFMDLMSNQISN